MKIVTVQRDVESTNGNRRVFDGAQMFRNAPRERHAARFDTDQNDVLQAAIALDDLVRDSLQSARDVARFEEDLGLSQDEGDLRQKNGPQRHLKKGRCGPSKRALARK